MLFPERNVSSSLPPPATTITATTSTSTSSFSCSQSTSSGLQLNSNQRSAISCFLDRSYSPVAGPPFLLYGPPGTGKTTVLSEIITRLVFQQQQPHQRDPIRILVCGPNNSVVDTLCLRLAVSLSPVQMIRLMSPSAKISQEHQSLRMYSVKDKETQMHFVMPSFNHLQQFQVIAVTSLHAFEMHKRNPHLHFTHIIIDECVQMTETMVRK